MATIEQNCQKLNGQLNDILQDCRTKVEELGSKTEGFTEEAEKLADRAATILDKFTTLIQNTREDAELGWNMVKDAWEKSAVNPQQNQIPGRSDNLSRLTRFSDHLENNIENNQNEGKKVSPTVKSLLKLVSTLSSSLGKLANVGKKIGSWAQNVKKKRSESKNKDLSQASEQTR